MRYEPSESISMPWMEKAQPNCQTRRERMGASCRCGAHAAHTAREGVCVWRALVRAVRVQRVRVLVRVRPPRLERRRLAERVHADHEVGVVLSDARGEATVRERAPAMEGDGR